MCREFDLHIPRENLAAISEPQVAHLRQNNQEFNFSFAPVTMGKTE